MPAPISLSVPSAAHEILLMLTTTLTTTYSLMRIFSSRMSLRWLAEHLSVSIHPFFALLRSQHASVGQEPDAALYRPALETPRRRIHTSTSSMTSVLEPLKFLRPRATMSSKRYMTSGRHLTTRYHSIQGTVCNRTQSYALRASLRTYSACWL
jgi:RPN1 N-terminal domain